MWLKDFIAAYEALENKKPEVDVWAIDVYPIDWTNTPNNDPAQPITFKGNTISHSTLVTQQLEGMRQYLNTVPEYVNTPIWITKIAIHAGYDGWDFGPNSRLVPDGDYHWDAMSSYMIEVLDWLETNASSKKIDKWFFFTTWRDIVELEPDGYMGTILFDGPDQGSSVNCLGEIYRARALGKGRLKCDATGQTITD